MEIINNYSPFDLFCYVWQHVDFYRLVVMGTDLGGRPGGLTGSGTVEIHVLDINDNLPTLEQSEVNHLARRAVANCLLAPPNHFWGSWGAKCSLEDSLMEELYIYRDDFYSAYSTMARWMKTFTMWW